MKVYNINALGLGRFIGTSMKVDPGVHDTVSIRCPETYRFSTYTYFRPVITRWSGSTSRMRVIGEARVMQIY